MKLLDFVFVISMLIGQGVTLTCAVLNPALKVHFGWIILLWAFGFWGTTNFFGRLGGKTAIQIRFGGTNNTQVMK